LPKNYNHFLILWAVGFSFLFLVISLFPVLMCIIKLISPIENHFKTLKRKRQGCFVHTKL